MNNTTLYKVIFINRAKVYEIYALDVFSSDIYGFIYVADLVFDQNQTIVIDPAEEKLRDEFENVNVLHLPMQSVIRIEEVKKKLSCKIRDIKKYENISVLPSIPRQSK
ncbi:hypothetical protein MNBD_GAMMA01-1107 [hydrothermal vent metagenome]|uniref:DUF1820 domain-containing protein n=1 Tax=hydrothermal vent metagenome TaxID=652676 RepID=A0A3B0WCQ4_9ZZZZ